MAEAHRTSVSVTDAASIDGPSSNPVQHRVDALEQELVDMKSTLQSLMKVIENLKEVSCAPSWSSVLSPPPAFRFASTSVDLPLAAQLPDHLFFIAWRKVV